MENKITDVELKIYTEVLKNLKENEEIDEIKEKNIIEMLNFNAKMAKTIIQSISLSYDNKNKNIKPKS